MKVELKLKRSLGRNDDICDWAKCKTAVETLIVFRVNEVSNLGFCDKCLEKFYGECNRFTEAYYSGS